MKTFTMFIAWCFIVGAATMTLLVLTTLWLAAQWVLGD